MALSFGAGFLVAKKKFDDLNDTQIEEIKKFYEEKYNKPQELSTNAYIPEAVKTIIANTSPEKVEEAIIEHNNTVFTNYQNMIHIISPMEFGEDESYDVVGLTYYFDGTLARDNDDEVIDDVDDVIGVNSLKYLGDYAEGVLYIKNDITNTYYEITESDKTYTEVTGRLQ